PLVCGRLLGAGPGSVSDLQVFAGSCLGITVGCFRRALLADLMKSLPIFVRALVVLILWLVLCWFIGSWLHLHGSNLWLLRIGLAVLGLAGFAGYLWLHRSHSSGNG